MGNYTFHRSKSDKRLPIVRVAKTGLVTVASLVIGTVAAVHAADEVYKYDALGRLIKVERPDGTHIEYDLDKVGNRVEKSVTQESQNSSPVAVNDSASISGVGHDTTVNAVANDTDPDNDTLAITAITQPWNGHASIVNTTQIWVLATNVGTGTFSYTVSDGNGGTDVGTITWTVRVGGGPVY